MSWHKKLPTIENEVDHGNIHLVGSKVENRRFDCCGLSMSDTKRSNFMGCTFHNIHGNRCSIGMTVFEHCRFENIWISDGPNASASLFIECEFYGILKGINFGFLGKPNFPDAEIKINERRASEATFCLDISGADVTSVCFNGDLLAEKVRFRERQCIILSAERLQEVAQTIFSTTQDKGLQLLLIGAVAGFSRHKAISIVESQNRSQLDRHIETILDHGIQVQTTPLC